MQLLLLTKALKHDPELASCDGSLRHYIVHPFVLIVFGSVELVSGDVNQFMPARAIDMTKSEETTMYTCTCIILITLSCMHDSYIITCAALIYEF